PKWQALVGQAQPPLFYETGMLWLAHPGDAYTRAGFEGAQNLEVDVEELSAAEIARRFPQFATGDLEWGFLERHSGVLLARRCVAAVLLQAAAEGVEYREEQAQPPQATDNGTAQVNTRAGDAVEAGAFFFACGPWLPKVFPGLVAKRMR